MRIIDLLTTGAAGKYNRAAIISSGVGISYGQMLSDVRRLAGRLISAGCAPGVKVAVVLRNSPEYLICFFAVSDAGGIIVPLSGGMTAYELTGYVRRAYISIVITSPSHLTWLLAEAEKKPPFTLICVQYDSNGNFKTSIAARGGCNADPEAADVALMVPTSGTTGVPKIVMLTDGQLISNMAVYRLLMGFETPNVVYCTLSLHHIYCICAQVLTHISLGDTMVLADKPFFVRDFLSDVETHKVTATAFVPYMAILLAEFDRPQEFDLRSLKYVTLSGAKTPNSAYETISTRYSNVRFINTYGMSEAGSRIAIAAPLPERFPVDSVGRPMPGVLLKISDDKGNSVLPGREGEILVKSSGVMKGYYRQPQLTSQTVIDGWLRTGDLGKLDSRGNLFILGRIKDVIITGGENIYPSEIEECLCEHPAVREAAVVARLDRLLQEVPCAFVVARNCSAEFTSDEVVRFCRKRLSSHKVPRTVIFLEKLPILGNSKVDKNALRKMANSSG